MPAVRRGGRSELEHYRATQSEATARVLPPGQDPFLGGSLGPCKVLEFLGEGGAGRVYRARHERLDFEVALKVIASEFHGRATALERFQREARVAARLSHNNIARVYDVDQEGQTHYIIQELVRGESLEARVKRKGPLDQATVVGIGASLASGLASIHQAGVVHRDLKPGNVILTRQGVPKLIDFGIAKDVSADSGTHQDVMLGTPRFMAPEQATSRDKVGPAADLYGLGGTLYFALTGQAPVEPEEGEALLVFLNRRLRQPVPHVADKRQDVFPDLDRLVQQLLQPDPDQRPPAQEVHDQLQRMLPAVQQLSEAGVGGSSSWRLASVAGEGTVGLLSDMPLIEIFQGIEFNEKSGELELKGELAGEPFTGRVTFKEGQPHEASTSDGTQGTAAIRRMLDLEVGSFLLRKDAELHGPAQIEVSFTRLVLDHSRHHDESERLPVPPLDSDDLDLEAEEQPEAEPAPGKASLARSSTLRLRKDGKPRRMTGDISRAVLELEQRICTSTPGDPFLGCDLGVFHVDDLLEVERGERRYLATVRETGDRAFLRVFPLAPGPNQQEFRRIAERAAGPLTLKGTRLEPCLGGGSSRDAFYAGYLPVRGQLVLEAVALRGPEDPFPPAEVVRLLGQAGLALQALHSRSMVHGNVHPGTIRIEQEGESVTLTGAGMGRTHPAHRFLGNDGSAPGELGYVAPEVLDTGKLTPAADMYALGCVAWTMLMGHHPFGGSDLDVVVQACSQELPPLRREGIPGGLATIVGKLAGRNPKQRYANANDFLTDLTAFERGKEVAAFRKEPSRAAAAPAARPTSRDPRGPIKLVLALSLLVGAGAIALAIWAGNAAGTIGLESPLEDFEFELRIEPKGAPGAPPGEAPDAPPDEAPDAPPGD